MRARKALGAWGRVYSFTGRRGSGAVSRQQQDTQLKDEEVDVESLSLSLSDSVQGDPHVRNVIKAKPTLTEVKLADLVTFRSSKSRKGSGWEGDFEVVPHVRSVIVLDDVAVRDLEVDEPWEHVDGEDTDNGDASSSGNVTPTKVLSYADVLSFSSK